jgi:hypothetical protein
MSGKNIYFNSSAQAARAFTFFTHVYFFSKEFVIRFAPQQQKKVNKKCRRCILIVVL